MNLRIVVVLVLLVLSVFLSCCKAQSKRGEESIKQRAASERTPQDTQEIARKELEKRWVSFTEDALFTYVKRGENDIVMLLLSAGMNPNASSKGGATALMEAGSLGNVDTLKILLDAGAAVDAEDTYGRTALVFAVQDGFHTEAVKTLLENGLCLKMEPIQMRKL
ncbi:MAG: ankyrin repeat domain-containing protein [Acidobacteriota bacterium]